MLVMLAKLQTMNRTIARICLLLLPVVAFLLVSILVLPVAAQEGAAPVSTITPNDVKEVSKQLWCPLCSGVRLDACELKACEQMREVIAVKLAEGDSNQEIKDYFVAQYGPQVLGEPPLEGFNWLAWILPVVVMIGGGVFLWLRIRSLIGGQAHATTAAAATPSASTDSENDYRRKLDEELKHYD